MTKRILRVLVISLVGFAALAAWWVLPGWRAEAQLSPRTDESVDRQALAPQPFYLQTDQRWAEQTVGGSGESFRAVGCTVCCLSMALAQHGIALAPDELNRRLKEADGYTARGWLKWDAVKSVSDEKGRVLVVKHPSHQDINAALTAGNPVLVKVLLSTGVAHWVLLVGRDGREYLMKDPHGNGKEVEPLSALGSDIMAVRIVEREAKE